MSLAAERRLAALEAVAATRQAPEPAWVAVRCEADLPAALAARRRPPGKIYIGVSPDDWDTENDQAERAAAERA